MRTASLLLALVVVLGFAHLAVAQSLVTPYVRIVKDFRTYVAGHQFGFVQEKNLILDSDETKLYAGPFGYRSVLFTATQGLVGFCCIILATLIIVPVVFTVRWKKKRVAL